jgi:hypothetical protein
MNLKILCGSPEDADYEGIENSNLIVGVNEMLPHHVLAIMEEAQNHLNNAGENQHMIQYLFYKLHFICLKYQLEMLAAQSEYLSKTRWTNLQISRPTLSSLSINFWKTAATKEGPFTLIVSSLNEKLEFSTTAPLPKALSDITGIILLEILSLSDMEFLGLDVERILTLVTEKIAGNIITWWESELNSFGFNSRISRSTFEHNRIEATIMSLAVEINSPFSVSASINPRTGFVSLSLDNFVKSSDSRSQRTLLVQGIQEAQQFINQDYKLIVSAIQRISYSVRSAFCSIYLVVIFGVHFFLVDSIGIPSIRI